MFESWISLQAAEKQVQGSDILGIALVGTIRVHQQRAKETQYGFTMDENEEGHVILREMSECQRCQRCQRDVKQRCQRDVNDARVSQ